MKTMTVAGWAAKWAAVAALSGCAFDRADIARAWSGVRLAQTTLGRVMSKTAAIALILGCFGCGGIADHEPCVGVAVGHWDEWTYVSHAHGGSHAPRWIWREVPPGEFECIEDWERDELCVTYGAPAIEGGESDLGNPSTCGGA